MNPYFFIVGCARSGTTLLQRILDAHSQLAIMPEIHWITNALGRGRWTANRCRVTRALAQTLATNPLFADLGIPRDAFLKLASASKRVPATRFLTDLFNLYATCRQKPLAGSKTPAYVRRLPLLHAIWPGVKFIHLIRDGRDVCLSVLNWDHAGRTAGRYASWRDDPVCTTAWWWMRKVQLGREAGRSLGPGVYYEMHYEALVRSPAEEIVKVCSFLNLPFEPAMLRFHEGRTRLESGLDAKEAWLPITPGLRDWRQQMSAENIERFEAAAGAFLSELGYFRAVPQPRPDVLARIAAMRDGFTSAAASQGDQFPRGW